VAPALLAFAADAGAFAALGGQHAGVAGVGITPAQVVLVECEATVRANPPGTLAARTRAALSRFSAMRRHCGTWKHAEDWRP
jgi:hypothetical protein